MSVSDTALENCWCVRLDSFFLDSFAGNANVQKELSRNRLRGWAI